MNEPHISLTGNLAYDPVVRSTPAGIPVVDLRVASTRRSKVGEEWEDGETVWFDVVCWKSLAENVGSSLHKGDRITVEGRLTQKTWVREDGTSSTKLVIDARHLGIDLSRYPVRVLRPVLDSSGANAFADKYLDDVTGELVAGAAAEQEADELAA